MAGREFAALLRAYSHAEHESATPAAPEAAPRIHDEPRSVRRTSAPPSGVLVVGPAEDRAEHDADRVADSVLARLNHEFPERHQHGPACGHGAAPVRRSAAPGPSAVPVVGRDGGALSGDLTRDIEQARSGGSPLAPDVRQRMESGFGGSLGGVRIHTGAQAARLSRTVAARAFTTGSDIFFGAGEYQPETAEGERVLAHELAHTRQQGGVSRTAISRLWDVKAKTIPWGKATEIRTLESRPIWFLADAAGDEIVVKPENQPVGLGQLVGSMQKKIAKVRSVDQRKLNRNDRLGVDNQIEINAVMGNDASWVARGDYLKAQSNGAIAATEDPAEVARADALAQLNDKKNNVIAMSVAEGDNALKAANPDKAVDSAATDRSKLRGLLSDPAHMAELGRMTMVDMFMGNMDRTWSGNLGNWFYSPGGAITLIDHVDPGSNGEPEMVSGMQDNRIWTAVVGSMQLQSKNLRKTTAQGAVWEIVKAAGRDEGESGGGDDGIAAWAKQDVGGTTRLETMNQAMLAGLEDCREKIIKIFSTTKWSLTNLKAHAAKKKLRSAAKQATAVDADDAAYGNQPLDYYATLKARAAWLKAN
ncbi:MAG: hypothetical protein QOE71_1848 [Pseudonocardiales bacterium]|jgi:hypothetical protein|nr:hypothetical protein [Pseudonocardiales bacterium]